MSRLKALFQKGFMRLTGGREFTILATDEVVITRADWNELCSSYVEKNKLGEQVQQLEEKCREEYNKGWAKGVNHSLPLACCKPQDEKLLAMISLIAKELIEQADVESCEWLFEKFHQCRSL